MADRDGEIPNKTTTNTTTTLVMLGDPLLPTTTITNMAAQVTARTDLRELSLVTHVENRDTSRHNAQRREMENNGATDANQAHIRIRIVGIREELITPNMQGRKVKNETKVTTHLFSLPMLSIPKQSYKKRIVKKLH